MHPPPARHHFIPQFYLNYFTDEKENLWEFDRVNKKYAYKTSYGTAWQKNYYRYKGKDGKKHYDIETELLKKIEDKTKPIIDKINKKELLTVQDKEIISLFVSFQKTRVPDFEKRMNEGTEKLIKEMNRRKYHSVEATKKILETIEDLEPEMKDKTTPEEMFQFVQSADYKVESPREHSISTMLKVAADLAVYFMQMEWVIFYAHKDSSFITSDSPFYIIPPKDRDPNNFWEQGVGVITPGARKIIPLSSIACLMMKDHGDQIRGMTLNKKQTRELNASLARASDRYIYGSNKTQLERIIKDTKIDSWFTKERVRVS